MPAFRRHKTATVDHAWDGPANKTRVKSGEARSYYAQIYGWYDPQGDEGVKDTYRFIHHEVTAEGTPGDANIQACSSAIGVLNGGRTGTTIPDADRQALYNHLAGHLKDAGKEAPELKGLNPERETRMLPVAELRVAGGDGEDPVIHGYAAVFDQYSEVLGWFREIIRPGAFAESLKSGDVRALWNHNPEKVLGRSKNGTLQMEEDAKGLKVTITPPAWAAPQVESIRRGDVDQMSFGFITIEDNWTQDDRGFLQRELLQVELFDVSPVTFPAYPQTSVAVRSRCQEMQAEKHSEAPPEAWRQACRQRELSLMEAIS